MDQPNQKRHVPGLIPVAEDQYAAEAGIRLDREAQDGGMIDSFMRGAASGDNYGVQVLKRFHRETTAPAEVPGYDPMKDVAAHKDEIPGDYIGSFVYARSPTEFQTILTDMRSQKHDIDILERRGGVGTFVARGLAGFVDIDTPFALLSGGVGAGAKAARWARLGRGALAGGATQAALATVAAEASTTGNWTDIPAAGLAGMGFGMLGAAFSKGASHAPEHGANEAIHRAGREFSDTLDEGTPLANRDIRQESFGSDDPYGSVRAEQAALAAKEAEQAVTAKPKAFDPNEVAVIPDSVGESGELLAGQRASVGASQLNAQGSTATIVDRRSLDMVQDAQTWSASSGVPGEYFGNNGVIAAKGAVGDAVANGARRFHDAVAATPLATDFDRLFKSGSAVAQKLAYDIFESASGIVRNNRSAAAIRELYERRLTGAFMPAYQRGYSQWAQVNGVSRWDQVWSAEARARFNREVAAELNGRAFDAPGTQRGAHQSVHDVADAHDRWSADDIEVGRGRPGEHSVKGYENLKAYSGYMSQKWSGARLNKLIQSGRYNLKQITDAVAEGYVAMHGVKRSDADKWASAVTRRAMASDRGTDMNLIGVLQQDGRGFLEDMLVQGGHGPAEVKQLMDRLTGQMEQRGQAGHTKGRMDIDLRFVASNGVNIMDLVDTDLAHTVARRARGTAGAAALARKGIRSKADRQSIIDAIKHEQQARGQSQKTGDMVTDLLDSDKHLTDDELNDLFSYFDAGPIAGGISPMYSRLKKLTNLALLNQLGLTQMAETGVQISAVGWRRWMEHAGEAFGAALGKADSPLAKELKHLNVMVAEEKLMRDDFAIEMDRVGTVASEFMQKVDHILNTGQRVQGYMSGFYAARTFQQRVAVTSAADKIMTNMAGLANDLSGARAVDLGLDPVTYARIKQYVDNGTVEFKDGSLHKLNLDKWDAAIAEDFALSLNRHVHQVVQKAMAGESSVLFHKDGVASLFFHLKSFPMLAMEKQAYRHARIGDTEAMSAFMLGLATAGAAYTVKQTINGRGDTLTPTQIAKGAFGLSNMAGWLPMWTDPLAGMLGLDSLRFNQYAQGIDNNVFSTPAALSTLNRMANIPGVPVNALQGELSNNDIRALQATPIIGNAYGFSYIFNAMKG